MAPLPEGTWVWLHSSGRLCPCIGVRGGMADTGNAAPRPGGSPAFATEEVKAAGRMPAVRRLHLTPPRLRRHDCATGPVPLTCNETHWNVAPLGRLRSLADSGRVVYTEWQAREACDLCGPGRRAIGQAQRRAPPAQHIYRPGKLRADIELVSGGSRRWKTTRRTSRVGS